MSPRSSSLLHDVIVVVGTFAILGTFFHVEIDALFVTAMLTVIGFSVHDTIVVFDRIRENKARHIGEPFADIVNHSILQTFGRSIMTSLTVLITLLVAVPVRRRRDQRLHPGPDHRHRDRDLLVDLRGEPAARRLAALGRPSAGSHRADTGAPRPPSDTLTADARGRARIRAAVSGAWHPDSMLEPRFRWTVTTGSTPPAHVLVRPARDLGLSQRMLELLADRGVAAAADVAGWFADPARRSA